MPIIQQLTDIKTIIMSKKRTIPASELIINEDGTIFHLHLLPEQIADIVLLVGDPGRVEMIASFFDSRECEVSNREFKTITGSYKGKRMTVLSTGIGIGNIDICVTELDALANIDFTTRQVKENFRQLRASGPESRRTKVHRSWRSSASPFS